MKEQKKVCKQLRINNPMLYTYTVLGAIFSVAQEKDMAYFYNGFTQLKYHEEWEMYVLEAHQNLLEVCPFLNTKHYSFAGDASEEETIAQIIRFLEDDYYVYIFLDWHYLIPEEVNEAFAHTTLISGYDTNRNIFYVSDNLDNGRFVTIEVDMQVVAKAFKSAWTASVGNAYDNDGSAHFSYLRTLTIFKYRDEVQVSFDKNLLKKELVAYLESRSTDVLEKIDSSLCGMNSYQILLDSINGNRKFKVGRRDYHMIYEHKFLMCKRVEFLIERGYIPNDLELLEQARRLMNGFELVRNLSIKRAMVTGEKFKELSEKMSTQVKDMLVVEEGMLHKLLTLLG